MVPDKGKGEMIALLVVRPGPLRDGLSALLGAMPEIGLVAQAEDAPVDHDYLRYVQGRALHLQGEFDDDYFVAKSTSWTNWPAQGPRWPSR